MVFLHAAKGVQLPEDEAWDTAKEARFEQIMAQAESLRPESSETVALKRRFQQGMAVWRVRASRRAAKRPKVYPETFVNSVGITMKQIGSGVNSSIKIARPYYIGVYEITRDQWSRVMGGEGGLAPMKLNGSDAMAFCRKLSEREGITYSLPTEAQWEYACRAGTTTAYAFGDNWSETASREPNPWGLYDMHGNLWEWCSDWASEVGGYRMLRGGSCYDTSPYTQSGPESCRSTSRQSGMAIDKLRYLVGFRVVATLK